LWRNNFELFQRTTVGGTDTHTRLTDGDCNGLQTTDPPIINIGFNYNSEWEMVSYWEKKDAYNWGHPIQSEFSTGSQTRQISTPTPKDYEVHSMPEISARIKSSGPKIWGWVTTYNGRDDMFP
jgi:hypothetical protein